LEHLIYRAVLEVPGDDIGPEDVRRLLLPESALIGHSAKDEIRQVDSGIVLATLKAHRGNKSAAARKLRISRGQLYKLLRKAETHALENSI
jgi:DNA-binding NtrC family response regulator